MVLGSSPDAVTSPSDFAPTSSKEFLDIQATIECGFTLKHVRDMTRRYSQMHRTYKYTELVLGSSPVAVTAPSATLFLNSSRLC